MVCRLRGRQRPPQRQRGASLVLALFIIVVLALLAAAMMNILAGGSESVAREVISTRALFVAESGAQRKLVEIFPPGGATNTGACVTSNWGQADWPGIAGCSTVAADVTCSMTTQGSVNYFTIRSTGTCGPAAAPAVRVVEIQARDGI